MPYPLHLILCPLPYCYNLCLPREIAKQRFKNGPISLGSTPRALLNRGPSWCSVIVFTLSYQLSAIRYELTYAGFLSLTNHTHRRKIATT